MLEKFKNRYFQLSMLFIIGFAVLSFQLAYLTVEKGEAYYALSLERKSVRRELRGTRGNILDRNGIPLAMNQQVFIVQLDIQNMPSGHQQINDLLMLLIEVLESNGETLQDNIPIKYSPEKGLYYSFGSKDLNVAKNRYLKWLDDMSIPKKFSASQINELFDYLRNERYHLDSSIPDDAARKIISIRMDIYANRYSKHTPVRVAEGVSPKTVAQLETFASQMPGVQTVVEAGRYYPLGEAGAQIVGYVGSIPASQKNQYAEAGYNLSNDKVGRMGIELVSEEWLTASTKDKHGELWAETTSSGELVRVLQEKLPQNGNNVVLTLDSRLQKASYEILQEELLKMREGLPPYTQESGRQAPYAQRGSVVILDVHTGEVLTMASYPSYDSNLFIPVISQDLYDQYQNDNIGKPFTPVAFMERFPSGSVFKMLMGIAGLMEGKVGINETIYDNWRYTKYSLDKTQGPKCWTNPGVHGHENIVDALKHSCDYYFYELADRLGIEKINEWADKFGLIGKTGLEIDQVDSWVGSPERKPLDEAFNISYNIRYYMREYLKDEFNKLDANTQKQHIERLSGLPPSVTGTEIYNILRSDLGYKNVPAQLAIDIWSEINQRKEWKPLNTVHTGIGQGYVQMTPISIARYVAALVNGGKVLKTHLIKEIVSSENETLQQIKLPDVEKQVEVNKEYIDVIRQGMWAVVNDQSYSGGGRGSAVAHFVGMDPSITLGGKTGTAQTGKGEEWNVAWFAAFTPYENPEVAVVITIPDGRTSANAAIVARKIIEEYYKQKKQNHNNKIPPINQIQ